jgi:hypothetical protein
MDKSFLLLFYKKEESSLLSYRRRMNGAFMIAPAHTVYARARAWPRNHGRGVHPSSPQRLKARGSRLTGATGQLRRPVPSMRPLLSFSSRRALPETGHSAWWEFKNLDPALRFHSSVWVAT